MSESGSKTRKRASLFAFLVAAQVLLVAAIWHHHQVLVAVYDAAVTDWAGTWFGNRNAADEWNRRSIRAFILQSEATAQCTGNTLHQLALARQWESLLKADNFSARTDTQWPTAEQMARYNVLILPAVSCMTHEDIQYVKAFLRNGGGVIMTWAVGVRDETGAWRVDSLLAHVGGLTVAENPSLRGEPPAAFMRISAQSPVTSGLPPGLVLQVDGYSDPLAAYILEPRVHPSAIWVNEPDTGTASGSARSVASSAPTAVAHGAYMGGRFVWLGFTDFASVQHPQYPEAAEHIVRNAVRWAGRQPRAVKPVWQNESVSAFSLSMKARTAEDIDQRIIDLARTHRMPLTLFVTPEVLSDERVRRVLQAPGMEVAIWDVKAARREDAYDVRSEARRLKRLHQSVKEHTGITPTGYLAKDGLSAEGLMDSLARAGFSYLVAGDTDKASPHLVRSYRPIPLITRPHETWRLPGHQPPAAQTPDESVWTLLVDRFEYLHRMGGYFHLLLDGERINDELWTAVDTLLYQIKQYPVWIASADDVHQFWQAWGNLEIATAHDRSGRVSILLSNSGQQHVRDATFLLELDEQRDTLYLRPLTLGSPPLSISSSPDGTRWRMRIRNIPPGKHFSYHLE